MTVPSTNNRADFVGNGATTVYPYGFRVFEATDLRVVRADNNGTETVLTLTTDYTVSGAGSFNGGNVTLTTALPSGWRLAIIRDLPLTQETDLRNQGPFLAETVEDALDRAAMRDLKLVGELARAIQVPETLTDVDTALPEPQDGAFLQWAPGSYPRRLQNVFFVDGGQAIAGSWTVDRFVSGVGFTGGVTTALTLSKAPASAQSILVTFDGVVQHRATYSVTSATLNLTSAVPVGVAEVEVRIPTTLAVGVPNDGSVGTDQLGDGVVTPAKLLGGAVGRADTFPVVASGRVVGATLADRFGDSLNLKRDFGAVGDGVTDDNAAIDAFFSACLSTGKRGVVPSGVYRKTGRLLVDLSQAASYSLNLVGDGPYKTKFVIESVTAPAVAFYRTPTGDPSGFYLQVEGIGFQTAIPGVGVAVGLSDFSDNIGNAHFKDCFFGNGAIDNGNVALQLNYLFDCVFANCVAVGQVGYGVALSLRQAQFCTFIGGAYSNSNIAIRMHDGVLISNTFLGVDIENCNTGISQEAAGTVKQLFVGGFWDIYRPDLLTPGTAGISTSAGGKCSVVIDNVHSTRIGMEFYGGSGLAANAKDANGRVQLRGFYSSSTPSMPGNGVTINNSTGQTQNVVIHGGTVSSIFIRGVNTGLTSGSFVLTPGDYIAIQYSSAPTWDWYPIP